MARPGPASIPKAKSTSLPTKIFSHLSWRKFVVYNFFSSLHELHHFVSPSLSMAADRLKLRTERDPTTGPEPSSDPDPENATAEKPKKVAVVDLGNGSQVLHMTRFILYEDSWNYFDYLDKNIPWTRPTIRVFARSHLQPRDTCYVASEGVAQLAYSGYKPHAYSWDEFPLLKEILDLVHKAVPGSSFNSLLLNRYEGGNDYVGWHADDEKLYGPTPEIASVSFGCERDFLLKKKPTKSTFQANSARGNDIEQPAKRSKKLKNSDQHSFVLKHGSLLVMSGYTQRDWLHSVPKRVKADSVRINLTFRHILF